MSGIGSATWLREMTTTMHSRNDERMRIAYRYRSWDIDSIRVVMVACRRALNGPITGKDMEEERLIRRKLKRRLVELTAVLEARGVRFEDLGQS